MRSYGQYCSVAKALDVIGDRWNLLVIRELLLQGPCRYTDLRNGLPGIATNLLSDRLRELEAAGLVRLGDAPSPDLVLDGPPRLILGLLAAGLTPAEAREAGLTITGDVAVLRRLQPEPSRLS